jgi:putative FmdB family regulatory protein
MPIYDFQCTSCGHKDELMRKISASNTTICPSCGKETFSKMLSAPSFQLNGTGWYASDFKDKKSEKNKSATDKLEAKSAESDTKTAACNPGCACH